MRKLFICSAIFIFTNLAFGTLFAETTYKDNSTGLFWCKGSTGKTWQNALSYCENLTVEGYSDWRLANKNEVATIMLNRSFLGNSEVYFWTSTSQSSTKAYCLDPVLNGSGTSYYYEFSQYGCAKTNSNYSGNGIYP